jgi:type VI secretion system protein ImpL
MGQPKLGGTGGTKNCDWWFAEDCILLDTAGRYTFNDENEPDREEWLEFLKLLKKYRPIAPINGLVVAVAADELLGREEDELVESARTIRHKLDQLVRELGIQFPVYLLITKCDLIEGFTEFFGRLPQRRLGEMLGWTNPSWEMGDPRKLVGDALGALRARVTSMRPGFLWETERPEQLRDVYLLPEEFRALERSLVEFGDVVFRENQYNESPFLRGIYLTSGLQKGTAVSAMLKRLGLRAQATELPEQRRSFFLKDFFQTRLPADRSLVATTGRARGKTQVVHNLALAVVAAAAVLVGVVTGGSYVANRTLLNDLEDEMRAAAGSEQRLPAETLRALARYVDVIERLEDRDRRRPLSAGWGLWTGGKAITHARALFLRRFERDAYRPAVDRARRLLRDRDEARGFPALEALVRDYALARLLASGRPAPADVPRGLLGGWGEMSADLLRPGRGYLAYLGWRSAEVTRAEQAEDLALLRQALPEMFTVERVAAWAERVRCTDDAGSRVCYPPLRAREIPAPAAIANGAEVRGAFRPEAWSGHVEPLVNAVEEIAPELDPQLVPRFREEFRDRYYAAWLGFVMQPRVGGDGQTPVTTLLEEQTPYLAIVERTAAAMGFDAGVGTRPAWADTVARVAGARADYLAHLAAIARQVRNGRNDPPAGLDDARGIFARRVALAAEEEAEPPPDPFGKAERWVRTLVNKGQPAGGEDPQVRARLQDLLGAPIYEAFRIYLDTAAQAVDAQWRMRIGALPVQSCQDLLALYGRPGGAIPEFVTAVMEPFFEPGTYQPKVRYRSKLPRSLAWLPPKEAQVRRNCGAGGAGGGGGGPCNVFFRSVPTGATPDGLFATRTVLKVFCGGEPRMLEHRNYPEDMHVTWSPDTCSRAEVTVSVGSQPDEVRPLEPRAAETLPTSCGRPTSARATAWDGSSRGASRRSSR